jgi:hypothetical protein
MWLWMTAALATPVFTGDVAADFTQPEVIVVADRDGTGDVALPAGITSSGWDVSAIALFYDVPSDTLYVGIDTVGILGDVDGDGDPGRTSPALASAGGNDIASLGGSEGVALLLDVDNDGRFDSVTGIRNGGTLLSFGTYGFAGSPLVPWVGFRSAIPGVVTTLFADPSALEPDLEFTITGLSQIPGSTGPADPGQIQVNLAVGSFADAGIGEDFVPAAAVTTTITLLCGAVGDSDNDGVCDDVDLCDGPDSAGDFDGDGVCDPTFSVVGTCPGPIDVEGGNLTPNGTFIIAASNNPGSVQIPAGPCAGTVTGLDASASLLVQRPANPSGEFSLFPRVALPACGRTVQLLDLSTCRLSEPTIVPMASPMP